MSRSRAVVLVLTVVPALALVASLPSSASAAPPPPELTFDSAPIALPVEGAPIDVLDAEAFAEVVDLTRRITPYLYVGDDGAVRLRDATAEQIGVSEEFLTNFRAAMVYSNELIARGDIQVAPDLTVTVTQPLTRLPPPVGVWEGLELASESIAVPGESASLAPPSPAAGPVPAGSGAEPEWGAWGYGSGAMFYNSYPDWIYYRHRYYGLCNSMAAYLGLPWMSPSLIYFYGYNQYYFMQYVYNPYGTYFFIPYSYCRLGFGYKPAYFWVRSFGPYGYYWGWRGFWVRY